MTEHSSDPQVPFVSIVIPARNEERHLRRVFEALARVDYPRERREVILVDNGSTDETAAVARALGATVITAPGVKVGEVRNVGARAARGEVLAFVDADCLVAPGWLRAAVRWLADRRIGAVGGSCRAPGNGNWIERSWVIEQVPRAVEVERLSTASFILRKEIFDELKGFDATLGAGEDDDFSHRIRYVGYALWHLPECGVIHLDYPNTFCGVVQRQSWHGRSQLHAGGLEPMVLLTHAFALALFIVLPFAVLTETSPLAPLAMGVTTLIAALPALDKERRSAKFVWQRAVQRAVVYWFFFAGRGFGLLRNYVDLIARHVPRRPVAAKERE